MGEGIQCVPNPCPPCFLPCGGACCLSNGICVQVFDPTQCQAQSGAWQGDGSYCVPATCLTSGAPEIQQEQPLSWGKIKSIFR